MQNLFHLDLWHNALNESYVIGFEGQVVEILVHVQLIKLSRRSSSHDHLSWVHKLIP